MVLVVNEAEAERFDRKSWIQLEWFDTIDAEMIMDDDDEGYVSR